MLPSCLWNCLSVCGDHQGTELRVRSTCSIMALSTNRNIKIISWQTFLSVIRKYEEKKDNFFGASLTNPEPTIPWTSSQDRWSRASWALWNYHKFACPYTVPRSSQSKYKRTIHLFSDHWSKGTWALATNEIVLQAKLPNCTLANGAVFHSVCQVWLSSGPPGNFAFSYCAWLRLAH